MPANTFKRVDDEGTYIHVYNKGIENRIIFNSPEDYEVFTNFLREYLTPASDPNDTKKTFTVKGQTFQGIPHQPKNYFNQVGLVAFALSPEHFHLLLHQVTGGSVQTFLRSLCTRYSMYFNKKYQHTGPLFESPYKSVHITDPAHLKYLTRFLHQNHKESSYKEFLGERQTLWVNPKVVLESLNAGESYKDFVENYKLNQDEEKILEGIILERESHLPEVLLPQSTIKDIQIDHTKENVQKPRSVRSGGRTPLYVGSMLVFALLFTMGLRNINRVSAAKKPELTGSSQAMLLASPAPQVEGEAVREAVMVKVGNVSESINIRQEPATESAVIGKANKGDVFEFLSENSGWDEVKLTDGSSGFILAKYLETEANQ